MKIKVTKEFENSKIEVEVEDSDDKKALMKALVFTQPDICGECKETSVRWDYNKAQTDDGDFIYIKRVCRKCGSQSTLGSFKGGGYFWKKWEKWERDGVERTATTIIAKNKVKSESAADFPLDNLDEPFIDNTPF